MKVYAVYSIPRSPEYHLEKIFKTKESAKKYIEKRKNPEKPTCKKCSEKGHDVYACSCVCHSLSIHPDSSIFDIQIEEVEE